MNGLRDNTINNNKDRIPTFDRNCKQHYNCNQFEKLHFESGKEIETDFGKAPDEPDEIEEANEMNAKVVLDNNDSINIKQLISLINNAKFIIANDTGPAHIASHLDKEGIVLFGSHTTAKKVSIENFNFKAISVEI